MFLPFIPAGAYIGFTLFDSDALSGLLAPVLFLTAVGLGAWAYARVHIAKAQDQAITTWRQNAEGQKERADIAERKLEEMREIKHALQTELAAEKLLHDQTAVMAAIASLAKVQAETTRLAKASEERIVETLAAQAETLERIAVVIVNGNGKG